MTNWITGHDDHDDPIHWGVKTTEGEDGLESKREASIRRGEGMRDRESGDLRVRPGGNLSYGTTDTGGSCSVMIILFRIFSSLLVAMMELFLFSAGRVSLLGGAAVCPLSRGPPLNHMSVFNRAV